MPTTTLSRLWTLPLVAVLAMLTFSTPAAAGGSPWNNNGATACDKYLTHDVVAAILSYPSGHTRRIDATSCNFGPIYISLKTADVNVFRAELPRIFQAHQIGGIGDDAFWNAAGALSAVKGVRGCDISVIDPGAPKIHNAELARKLGAICNKLFAIR